MDVTDKQLVSAEFKIPFPDLFNEDEIFNSLKDLALKNGWELVSWR